MGAVGVMSLVSVFVPTFENDFEVGEAPLAVLVVVVLLLNSSLMRRRANVGREPGR